jgi:predicted transcriptional regulator
MPDQAAPDTNNAARLTANVVSSYLSNHHVSAAEIPELIAAVHAAFAAAQSHQASAPAEQFAPAVSVKKSLRNPDRIISMIDGKPYSALTRHLSSNGLTPAEYRERYNLPTDYPMVARGYSERRSLLAKALGLGKKAAPNVIGEANVEDSSHDESRQAVNVHEELSEYGDRASPSVPN